MSENIQLRPAQQSPDVFDRSIRGGYGRFQSDKSYPLSYVQASISIESVNWLETASEAFRSYELDFEELIQRDIDKERVINIVDDYLKKGEDRVLFFPPLLVSLVALGDEGILGRYESVREELKDHSVELTWGGDRFQLILPTLDSATGHQVKVHDKDIDIAPYWSVLRLNSNKIKLVVIDGQHRLQALKSLWNSSDHANKKVVKNLSIPICLLFSPEAVEGEGAHESMNRDMRELFVRINSEGKKVSGHFIALLNDRRLSSFAVREFCNYSKSEELSNGLNYLCCVEWNQRVDRLASQINRPYTITTIQIISDTLSEHAFDPKLAGRARYLLNLKAFKENLETDSRSIPVDEISEESFSISQIEFLRKLTREMVAPALAVLFFEPAVYKKRIEATNKAAEWLNQMISKEVDGAEHCKLSILDQYRDPNELDPPSSRDIYREFSKRVLNASPSSIHFYNVFQQGLIRAWITLTRLLFQSGFSPVAIAKALVTSIDHFMVIDDKRFDAANLYGQKLIFNGSKVIVNKRAKNNWERLILLSFGNQAVLSKFEASVSGFKKEDLSLLKEKSSESLKSYLSDLKKVIEEDYRKYWRDKELDEQVMEELEDLDVAAMKGDEDALEEFNNKIGKYALNRYREAETKLKAAFGI